MKLGRRDFIASALAAITVAVPAGVAAAPVGVEVWKAPTCGCCKDWIRHLESNGFKVQVHDSGNTAARARLGISMRLGSCHTAQVEGLHGRPCVRHTQRPLRRSAGPQRRQHHLLPKLPLKDI